LNNYFACFQRMPFVSGISAAAWSQCRPRLAMSVCERRALEGLYARCRKS
jgi:hypothetical protein